VRCLKTRRKPDIDFKSGIGTGFQALDAFSKRLNGCSRISRISLNLQRDAAGKLFSISTGDR